MVTTKRSYTVEAKKSVLITDLSYTIPEGYEKISNYCIPLAVGSYAMYFYNTSLTYIQLQNTADSQISGNFTVGILCRKIM